MIKFIVTAFCFFSSAFVFAGSPFAEYERILEGAASAAVWSALNRALLDNGVATQNANKEEGTLVTEWILVQKPIPLLFKKGIQTRSSFVIEDAGNGKVKLIERAAYQCRRAENEAWISCEAHPDSGKWSQAFFDQVQKRLER